MAGALAGIGLFFALNALRAAEPTPAPRLVSFPTTDGGVVYANVYGTGPRCLVLAHGGQFTKESWAKQAPVLVEAGFRVLAFDFRGRGQSRAGRAAKPGDEDVYLDVLGAVAYLQENGAEKISVLGASFGGWAAARASAEAPAGSIDRLVLLAASGVESPEKIRSRTLFIVARDDANASGPRLPGIQRQYGRAPQPKELLILEGKAHAQFLFDTDQAERLMREILRFLTAK
jgi:pimeloyl-ACP methyl ester carboxylesterase